MSFPRYSKYKDVGVDWLGEVPSHWNTAPLWTLFARVKRVGCGDEELLSVYRDYGVIPKSSRDDNYNKPSDDLSTYQLVEVGDLAINKMKAWQGSVAISDYRGIVSPAYHVYAKQHSQIDRFLHHLFRSSEYTAGYLSNSKGIRVNQWDLEPQQHSRMPVLLPPRTEQEAIASFLDHETTKIDALIAEQQRLVELLKEKRQAVISHAVTKGLNPDVPMKDSGVEWLGEVPAHWEVMPLKRVLDFVTSGSRGWAAYYSDDGAIFLRIGNLTRDSIQLDLSDLQRVTVPSGAEGARTKVAVGDLLFSITADLGSVAVVRDSLGEAYVSQHIALARVNRNSVLSEWIGYLALSNFGKNYFANKGYGGTKVQLSLDDVRDLPICLPPRDEQEKIVASIEAELAVFNKVLSTSAEAIRLLVERRSALISAAVAGKIDVRNWKPKGSKKVTAPSETSELVQEEIA